MSERVLDARLHGHRGGVEEERMSQYRKKPIVVEAHQWFKNGDHPDDHCPPDLELTKVWPDRDDYVLNVEGKIVRRYRHPSLSGDTLCKYCRNPFHVHGWIDGARNGGAECTVCPGDWIIRGVNGEVYPCKPDIFEATYEALASNPEPEDAEVEAVVVKDPKDVLPGAYILDFGELAPRDKPGVVLVQDTGHISWQSCKMGRPGHVSKIIGATLTPLHALRSQAGQGRVVTAEMVQQATCYEHSLPWDVKCQKTADVLNALLAAQEQRP